MARTRRRKKRTHVPAAPEGAVGIEKVPKSFVLSRGKLPQILRNLQHDLRQVMMPHTASKLRVVLNGFGTTEEHLKLIQIMFQNMFPVINVHNVKLATCQRVLLLNYDKKTKCIDFRHYSISAQPVGVTRSIRKLVQRKKLPDLGGLGDVSEFVTRSGYGSESEVEDEASKVQLADEFGKGNHASQQSAVKLHEVGPRLKMQLVKVEEGLCSGGVMFHEYVKKTPEEVAVLRAKVEQREALRKQRKAEQEANVKKKEALKASRKKKRPEHEREKEDKERESDSEEDDQPELRKEEDKEDDDAEWYRKEVGHEPDEAFLSGARRWNANRPQRGRGGKFFGGKRGSAEGMEMSKHQESTKSAANGDDRKDRYKKRAKFENNGDDNRKERFGKRGGDDSRGRFGKKRGSSGGDKAPKRQRYKRD
ncbi:hypothetical protein AXG93_2675s1200 [Marchantia polymorpha subsp. ruderalis]|uniref:Brix domain-containing protein n=1 Tax=Marchantia polymorpha subsp. ruderalis TaxID=1480154 RepID=A0A176VPX1_MARPO|nr:hypothetical protein AXG93_2675s1200 [Marchantia polymorpha subsp. ruderalis]